jgi:hypothetical protein
MDAYEGDEYLDPEAAIYGECLDGEQHISIETAIDPL